MKTTAWRVVASKRLVFFGLAAGVGKDEYESRATVACTVNERRAQRRRRRRTASSQKVTRTNMLRRPVAQLSVLKLVGEVGRCRAATIDDVQHVHRQARRRVAHVRLAGLPHRLLIA